jgi:hypothetical protein
VRCFRIEETFKTFVAREDIAIILINQHIAEMIRYAVDQHIASIPAVLEIPSKEMPYDPSKACLLLSPHLLALSFYSNPNACSGQHSESGKRDVQPGRLLVCAVATMAGERFIHS